MGNKMPRSSIEDLDQEQLLEYFEAGMAGNVTKITETDFKIKIDAHSYKTRTGRC